MVRISLYDIDSHPMNCRCGQCGQNKKSYGFAVFADWDTSDPLDVIYGPSEPAAFQNARLYCRKHNFGIVGDIVQNPDGSHSGHPTVEFTEDVARIFCSVGHIVTEVPLSEWIGSPEETRSQDPSYSVTATRKRILLHEIE